MASLKVLSIKISPIVYDSYKTSMTCANADVNKSFDKENVCIAGAPARKIGDMGRFEIEERDSKEFK